LGRRDEKPVTARLNHDADPNVYQTTQCDTQRIEIRVTTAVAASNLAIKSDFNFKTVINRDYKKCGAGSMHFNVRHVIN
jgi:hypothetical protein